MKRIIFILFLLLFNLIYAKERSVSIEKITEKNGITYIINEKKPFTGIVIDSYELNPSNKNNEYKVKKCTREWVYSYKDGSLDKFSIIYYTNGKMWARGNYKGNKGETVIYFNDGKISERINYTDNKLDGKWIVYSRNGNILSITHYENGRCID